MVIVGVTIVNVSDWPAIAITGGITLTAALGAVGFREFFQRRRADREKIERAYKSFATASGIFQMRVEVFLGDKQFRRTLIEVFLIFTKVFAWLLFESGSRISKKSGPELSLSLAKLLTVPSPTIRSENSYQAMLDSLELVLAARTDIAISGSLELRKTADEVLEACSKFETYTAKPIVPWDQDFTKNMNADRNNLNRARSKFNALIEREDQK